MNLGQRMVAVGYCLLVFYCCTWIPWHSTEVFVDDDKNIGVKKTTVMDRRHGYAWVWSSGPDLHYLPEDKGAKADSVSDLTLIQENAEVAKQRASETPDLLILALRLSAATALGLAMFLLAGITGRRQLQPVRQQS